MTMDPEKLTRYFQRAETTLDSLRATAHELVAIHGDSVNTEMALVEGIMNEAISAEVKARGTGIAGVSGLVAHMIFNEIRRERTVSDLY